MLQARADKCSVVVSAADGGKLRLTARYTAGEPGAAVVAPPHPLYGGTLDNPVVIAIARGLSKLGLATLTFNYRGVEGSEGKATENLEAAVADYRACLDHLTVAEPAVRGPLVAAGYSFGAAIALLAAQGDPRVAGLVLLAPPVGMLRTEDLAAFAGPILIVVGDDDDFAPVSELRALLPVPSRENLSLQVIDGADHFFHFGGLGEIEQRVNAGVQGWLAQR